jgi:hypothetical protein
MSALWRLITGNEPSRPRSAPRPKVGLRPEVTGLEGRQLNAIVMGVAAPPGGGPAIPAVTVSPKVLFPSNGRYVPIHVSGGVSSTYAMTLDGAYKIFPKPSYTARILAQLPLPDPTSTAPVQTGVTHTYEAFVPGSKTPVTVPYSFIEYTPPSVNPPKPTTVNGITLTPTLTGGIGVYSVTLPGFKYPEAYGFIWQGFLETQKDPTTGEISFVTKNGQYVISPNGTYQVGAKDLPVSDFEKLVINGRLTSRRGPADVVSQVTDQYRQDEPHVISPLTLLAAPTTSPFGAAVFVPAQPSAGFKYSEQIGIPSGVSITRFYSYSFTTHLQALKHTGTGGRQYILNVASEDADDGGSANTAVVVPNDA